MRRAVHDVCRYLHERNIMHRDLKLENILFSSDPKERASQFSASPLCLSL